MKLEIVIPFHNQVDFLRQCVQSIVRTYPRQHEVTVRLIDNGSTEKIPAAWASGFQMPQLLPNFRILTMRLKENTGVTHPWNLGAHHAFEEGADAVCIANSDVIFGFEAIRKCLRAVTELGRYCVFPRSTIRKFPGDFDRQCLERAIMPMDRKGAIKIGVGFAGWCFFLSRKCWEDIGRFDEGFTLWYQDTDYFYRLTKAKKYAGRVDVCLIHHFESRTIVSMPNGVSCYGWRTADEKRFREKWKR